VQGEGVMCPGCRGIRLLSAGAAGYRGAGCRVQGEGVVCPGCRGIRLLSAGAAGYRGVGDVCRERVLPALDEGGLGA
jgi:hypothetical protein